MTVSPRTSLGRLVPALLVSQVGFYVALLTPVQLLLTLRLSDLAGDDATSAFGIVTGAGALVALVFNPIAGRISDRTLWRFGRRRTWILTGSLAGAAALVALGAATSVWQVVLLWAFVQALFNFQYAATNALVADQVPAERRGGVSGLVGLTIAVGPLAGLALANGFEAGSARQWQAVAAVAAIAGVLAVVLLRDTRGVRGRGGENFLRTFWINPRHHPAFGWAWLVRFLITCAYASSSYNAFYLLQRFDVAEDEVGGMVLQLSLISVVLLAVTSVSAGYLSDAVRRQKPFIVFAGVVAAVALVLMAFAPSLAFVYVATGLLGIGTGAFFAIDLAMCVRVLPSTDDAGKDLAIINIANSLPQSVVPFVAPLLLAIGGYTALFGFLALLGVLGAVSVRRVPEIGQEHDESGRTAPITRHDLVSRTASDERTLA
ncbi:MFS transporter [Actinoplanes sp. RD1]|uniref:MFS transporter n=1 Tax=Actinoplanes sp. RD1 TaxID=3064538 RepID=UPI002740DAD8|nr:MFS transporter [Actinoplanes sp. RD1]